MISPFRPQDSASPLAGFSFQNIAANGTTTAKTGAGILVGIVVNTKGASANTCVIYDNTAASGTKIGTFDTTVPTAGMVIDMGGIAFSTGLTAVLATGTAADWTLIFK